MSFLLFRNALPYCLAGLTGLAQAAPLTFQAALDLAEQQSPAMRAQRAQLEAAEAAAIPAGALPDPKLLVGIDNYPVSGPMRGSLTGDFMTMRKIGLMQDVPSAAKRHAREEAATADIELARTQVSSARLALRRDVAQAWITRYTLERKQAALTALAQENRLSTTTARAQLASGRLTAADALAPQLEAAQLADRRDELTRDLAKARAALSRLLGEEGNEALAGGPPDFALDTNGLRQHLAQHPELRVAGAQTQRAQAEVALAEADKRPGWGVELAYQQRGAQFGNMVSLQFTVDLPILSGQRQQPLADARRHELDKAVAEQDAMAREHRAQLEDDLAELAQLDAQLDRMRRQWLPLAQQKTALALAGYQAGRGGIDTVIAARRERLELQWRLIEQEGLRTQTAARLYYGYGEHQQ